MKSAALLVAVFAVACGPKAAPPPPSGGPQPLAAGQWHDMDTEARAKFMGTVIKPTMKAMFQGFDAKRFADFDCKTCHGPGVKDGKFDMPNPLLPKLTSQQIQTPSADDAAITEFMKTQVRPTMAKLLGIPEWSPIHPNGFGCFDCHTQTQ